MEKKPTLTIFISSPGDVAEERTLTEKVIGRLRSEFAHRTDLEPIFWEHEPLRATESFQDGLPLPSEADIVISILWTRLGTRLPAHYKRVSSQKLPPTGTEFELQDAKAAFLATGSPDLLVYRKTDEPLVSIKDRETLRKRLEQMEALEEFVQHFFYDDDGALKAAFHTFEKAADYEIQLERHLRKLIDKKVAPAQLGSTGTAIWVKESPYRSLFHFDVEHAPIFFGRSQAVAEVLENLRAQAAASKAFVLIQGMSGSGKSSLARAGVLPMLMEPGVIETIGLWRYAVMSPSDGSQNLLLTLAKTIAGSDSLPEILNETIGLHEIEEMLRENPEQLQMSLENGLGRAAEIFQTQKKIGAAPQTRLALIVDQLEEIFTIEEISHENRVEFIGAISSLARCGLVWVVGTLRSDFYNRCEELDGLINLKKGYGQYHLRSPNNIEIGQMIRFPAQAAGLKFEENPDTKVPLDEVLRDAAVASPESLPLLEFTLEQLYQKSSSGGLLSFRAYEEMGQLQGALSQHADETLRSLSSDVQATFGSVIRKLITVGQNEDDGAVRRWYPLEELLVDPSTKKLTSVFIAKRLFVSDRNSSGVAIVSLSHEILLRTWPVLKDHIEADMQFLSSRSKMERFFETWQKENESEGYLLPEGNLLAEGLELLYNRETEISLELKRYIQESSLLAKTRQKRKTRVLATAVVVFGILALIAGFGAYKGYLGQKNAEIALERAEKQNELALQAVQKLTYDIPDKLSKMSGTTRLLSEIFTENVLLLDKIYALSPETEEAQREKGVNLSLIGDRWLLLGDTAKAKDAYNRALEIRLELAESNPDDLQIKRDLAINYSNFGDLYLRLGDTGTAEQWYQKALVSRQHIVKLDPENGEAQRYLGVSHERQGSLQLRLGDINAAIHQYQEALRITEHLARLDQSDEKVQGNLAVILTMLGKIYLRTGHNSRAEKMYLKAFDIRHRMTLIENDNVGFQRSLAYSYDNLGTLYLKSENFEKSAEMLSKGLALHQKLTSADKDNYKGQIALALAHLNFGDLQRRLGAFAEVVGPYNKALDIFTKLVVKDPFNTDVRVNQALLLERLGHFYFGQDNIGSAEEYSERAFEIRQGLVSGDSEDLELARDLSISYEQLADIHIRRGEISSAEDEYLRSLEIRQRLCAAAPKNSSVQKDMAVILSRLGVLYTRLSKVDLAKSYYTEALEYQAKRAAVFPERSDIQRDLMLTYMDYAKMYKDCRRFPQASGAYRKAYDISVQPVMENGQNELNPGSGNSAKTALIHTLYMQVKYTNKKDSEEILKLCNEILELDPNHIFALDRRGQVYARQGRAELAEAEYRKIIEIAPDRDIGWGNLGGMLIRQNRASEALEPINKAIELKPTHFTWYLYLGHIHLLLNEEALAQRYYKKAVEKNRSKRYLHLAMSDLDFFVAKGWNVLASTKFKEWFGGLR